MTSLTPVQQFWQYLHSEAQEGQRRRRNLGVGCSLVLVLGLALYGTYELPGLGTIAGAAVGSILAVICIRQTHADQTFDRLDALVDDEPTLIVGAIQRAYAPEDFTNRPKMVALYCLREGIIGELLNQIDEERKKRLKRQRMAELGRLLATNGHLTPAELAELGDLPLIAVTGNR